MEIAIDISPLGSGHSLRGTGSYTALLIDALQQYEGANSYYFFTRGQKIPKNVDLVHYPYFDPFFLTLPLHNPKPMVVTVHDLIPLAFPTHFLKGVRGEIKWHLQRQALTHAKAVITDSQASKADITKYAHIPSGKIHVIYLAPADSFKKITNASQLRRIREKYSLPIKFILYVGDVNWNKNLPGLLKALAELESRKLPLVFVGKSFLNENLAEVKELNALISKLSLTAHVLKIGFVDDIDLPFVYTLASVYVQPSFAEGFGLPVLEAMASGVPVVVSRAPSLQEIAGPSVVVGENNPRDIAKGIEKAIRIDRNKWSHEAESWVKKFSWKKVASQTTSVYERIASR